MLAFFSVWESRLVCSLPRVPELRPRTGRRSPRQISHAGLPLQNPLKNVCGNERSMFDLFLWRALVDRRTRTGDCQQHVLCLSPARDVNFFLAGGGCPCPLQPSNSARRWPERIRHWPRQQHPCLSTVPSAVAGRCPPSARYFPPARMVPVGPGCLM